MCLVEKRAERLLVAYRGEFIARGGEAQGKHSLRLVESKFVIADKGSGPAGDLARLNSHPVYEPKNWLRLVQKHVTIFVWSWRFS